MENFLSLIAEILEVDEVNLSDELRSFESWDSLAVLSIIAMVGEKYNVKLTANNINQLATVKDLQDFISSSKVI